MLNHCFRALSPSGFFAKTRLERLDALAHALDPVFQMLHAQ
jgi:hypothetical protein